MVLFKTILFGLFPDGLLALLSVVIQCTDELDSNWKTG